MSTIPCEAVVTDFRGEITVRRGEGGLLEVHCLPLIPWEGEYRRIRGASSTIIREMADGELELEDIPGGGS